MLNLLPNKFIVPLFLLGPWTLNQPRALYFIPMAATIAGTLSYRLNMKIKLNLSPFVSIVKLY